MNGFMFIADALASPSFVSHLSALGTWLLAWTFGWAGVTKLRRPMSAAIALQDFGIVRDPRPVHGFGLAVFEIGLGISMMLPLFGPVLHVFAATVLAAFAVAISLSLLQGRSFPCMCFGEADEVISLGTLLRTTLLVGIAALLCGVDLLAMPLSLPPIEHVLMGELALALLGALALARSLRQLAGPPSRPKIEVLQR